MNLISCVFDIFQSHYNISGPGFPHLPAIPVACTFSHLHMCLDCCLYPGSPHTLMAPYLIVLALPRRKSPSIFPQSSLQVPSCCFIYLTNIYIARYEQPCPQHSNEHPLTGFSLGPPCGSHGDYSHFTGHLHREAERLA